MQLPSQFMHILQIVLPSSRQPKYKTSKIRSQISGLEPSFLVLNVDERWALKTVHTRPHKLAVRHKQQIRTDNLLTSCQHHQST